MSYQLSSDIVTRIQTFIASGSYANEDDVVRDALSALEHRQLDLVAIQEGVEDMEAGRFRSLSEFDKEFRAKHNIPNEE